MYYELQAEQDGAATGSCDSEMQHSPALRRQGRKRSAASISPDPDNDTSKKRARVINLHAYGGLAAHAAGAMQHYASHTAAEGSRPRGEPDKAVQAGQGVSEGCELSEEEMAVQALVELKRSEEAMAVQALVELKSSMNRQGSAEAWQLGSGMQAL